MCLLIGTHSAYEGEGKYFGTRIPRVKKDGLDFRDGNRFRCLYGRGTRGLFPEVTSGVGTAAFPEIFEGGGMLLGF